MTDDTEPTVEAAVHQGSRAFFGRISASVSHELNNVLAIIGQSAGLLEDLLEVHPEGEPIPRARLDQIALRIDEQVERGTAIIKRFHQFAHSVDEPHTSFDVKPTLQNLQGLLQRLADLAMVTIRIDDGCQDACLTGNPFLVQQAVFMVIQSCLGSAQAGDTIRVTAVCEQGHLVIHLDGPAGDRSHEAVLERLLQDSGGRLTARHADGRCQIELAYPLGVA